MEKRPFKVSPNIVMSLIKAQCGSLGKAVAECIANSYDAGATRVDIEMTREGIVVRDDGHGFASRTEIEAWFEVFGFDHSGDASRKMGAFGIGRAQLWAFASTVWRTNTFRMTVDVKHSGLDYGLEENLEAAAGVEIAGRFYERITTADMQVFERDIEELVRFMHIPVYLNADLITKDPTREKWTHDLPEAWIKVVPRGRQVTFYNLGMKVADINSYQFGVGGVVVTKPGVKLALNMARNAVLESECKVWKKIKPFLRAEGEKATRKGATTEEQLTFLAKEFLADIDNEEMMRADIFTDVRGRKLSISTLETRLAKRSHQLTVAPAKSAKGDYIEGRNLGVCLAEVTLERFGVDSLGQLLKKIKRTTKHSGHAWSWSWLDKVKLFESVDAFPTVENLDYRLVQDKDLSKAEKVALAAIKRNQERIGHLVMRSRNPEGSNQWPQRQIRVGSSEIAEAWTDGITYIALNHKVIKKVVSNGLPACLAVATLLAHEYLHDIDSAGSHSHDLEFMEHFHDATCGMRGLDIMAVGEKIFRSYLIQARAAKITLHQAIVRLVTEEERSESDSENRTPELAAAA